MQETVAFEIFGTADRRSLQEGLVDEGVLGRVTVVLTLVDFVPPQAHYYFPIMQPAETRRRLDELLAEVGKDSKRGREIEMLRLVSWVQV
jgi:hypothetical protein